MRKLFSLFAALTLSVGLWAEEVSYLYPVYNEGDATKGIQKWETTTVEATAVTSSTSTAINAVTWGTAGQTTWFVVKGEDVQLSKGAICAGDVRLILADNAKLTAKGTTQNAGIQVSNGNSLTIYAQSTGTQMGQLIAECSTMVAQAAGIGGKSNGSGSNIIINGGIITATGGKQGAAGIGGGYMGSGTDITINGGTVTATGGQSGAGIGGGGTGSGSNITINGGTVEATGGKYSAGIGGGSSGSGSNITILAGTVTATGADGGAGIGSGNNGSASSNIFVATKCIVKAGDSANPTDEIAKTRTATTDIASDLAGKRYATVETPAKGDLTSTDFEISNNSVTYNGEAKAATVALKSTITGAGTITVTYKQNSAEVASPTNAGEYDIYAAVAEGDDYNAFASAKIGTLTIAKATLTASDFTYLAPEDLTWDGNEKTASVTFNDQSGKLSGCGEVAINYQKDAVETSPVDAGDYTVSIDVAEGTNYESATALTDEDWKFTIEEPAPVTFTLPAKTAGQYATICLPQPIESVTNGTLYKISYGNVYEVHFVEETNFAADPAGTPYLVQAIADGDIVFTMTDATPVTDPVGVEEAKGFVASLQEEMQAVPEGYEYLLVSGGALHSAGAGCLLSKNHAYIDVNYVPETEPVVPGAPRRVTLYNAEAQSPTGLRQSAITNHKSAMKVVKNGQFVIIRDNKAYNAQGIEVQ